MIFSKIFDLLCKLLNIFEFFISREKWTVSEHDCIISFEGSMHDALSILDEEMRFGGLF